MTKTVAFIYGFSEGQWHGKRFRAALQKQNYKVIKTVRSADIIISHSAGSFYVPPSLRKEQLLVLINPPYWPGRSHSIRAKNLLSQVLPAIRPGNQPFYHLNKLAHNIVYGLRHVRKSSQILKRAPKFNLEIEVQHTNTVLIRNNHDAWLTPHLEKLQEINPHLTIYHLPGEHDDCWIHPEPYIAQLQAKLKT